MRSWNAIERATGLPVPLLAPQALRTLNAAVRRSDAVVIHDSLYLTSIAGAAFARLHCKPLLVVQHIADLPLRGRVLKNAVTLANRLVTRPLLATADQAVFISDTIRRRFAAVSFRRAPQLLFNGVDTEIFFPGPYRQRSVPRHILFVGRFVAKKGLTVIEALARARPDLHFTLAGRGPIEPEAWQLGNVRVERGRSGARLADLYREADLLLLPSVGEGYPLVVQEAMACGLPVICGHDVASADPAAARWLAGCEIDQANPAATAARIATLLDAPVMADGNRAEMAIHAARSYSWHAMARAIVRSLERTEIDGAALEIPAASLHLQP